MSKPTITTLLIISMLSIIPACFAQYSDLIKIWPVDPLTKVFKDAQPQSDVIAFAESARGETATFQLVIKSDKPLADLRINKVTSILHSLIKSNYVSITPSYADFVGYVPVTKPTPSADKDQLRKLPADYPDPLLEDVSIDLPANTAQPIWVAYDIPPAATPGTYYAAVAITCTIEGKQQIRSMTLSLKVYPVTVGPNRLWVTNWFFMRNYPKESMPKEYSDEYWQLLEKFAKSMASHRQNVAWANPLKLAKFAVGSEGKLKIDFTNFDKWVQILIDQGVIGRIEGGHLGGRKGDWGSQFVINIRTVENSKVVSKRVDPDSPEADKFYAQFLPTLVDHLREKDWLGIYTQHIADEPVTGNIKTYRQMSELVKKYAPEFKIIEACHTKDLAGAIDVWVPQLNFYDGDYDYYRSRQSKGEEVWFYTCMHPQGNYANRFIEQPLIKTRLLHWINFQYGATGYLHWGYNYWQDKDPYKNVHPLHGSGLGHILPAGDPFIVYPGKNGPVNSIRFEAMRDGIADHELLSMLAEKDPKAARELSSQMIRSFKDYSIDVKQFRQTRHKLLELLSE